MPDSAKTRILNQSKIPNLTEQFCLDRITKNSGMATEALPQGAIMLEDKYLKIIFPKLDELAGLLDQLSKHGSEQVAMTADYGTGCLMHMQLVFAAREKELEKKDRPLTP